MRLRIPLLAGALPALVAGAAAATPIEVAFRAIVTDVRPVDPGGGPDLDVGTVTVGSEISGSYRFESSRSPTPNDTWGLYDEVEGPFGLTLSIGSNEFHSVRVEGVLVRTVVADDNGWWRDAAPLPTDQISVVAQFLDLSRNFGFANLYFVEPTGTAFSGIGLPATAPDLDVFTTAELRLWHESALNAVSARIVSTTLVVPEPATGLLLGVGLVVLALRRRAR